MNLCAVERLNENLRKRINAVTIHTLGVHIVCVLGLFVHRSNKIIMSDTTHSYTQSYCCQWHECSGFENIYIFFFDTTLLHFESIDVLESDGFGFSFTLAIPYRSVQNLFGGKEERQKKERVKHITK